MVLQNKGERVFVFKAISPSSRELVSHLYLGQHFVPTLQNQ